MDTMESEDLRRAFEELDAEKSGMITLKTMEGVFNKMGREVSTDDLQSTLSHAMGRGSQTSITFEEFSFLMSHMNKMFVEEDEMYIVFRYFDQDGDGFISPDELKDLLLGMGEEISEDDLTEMISEADKDGDGRVSFDEFVNVMTSQGSKKNTESDQGLSLRVDNTEDAFDEDQAETEQIFHEEADVFETTVNEKLNEKAFKHHAKRRQSCFVFGSNSSQTKLFGKKGDLEEQKRPRSRSSCGRDLFPTDATGETGGRRAPKKRLSMSASATFLKGIFKRKSK